ncbi:MAG: HU family DNA-binding protein [Myxococcales bacterium]|nr:HU family DNA-binding protein [Myxococcales bacterium]MCB9702731.1 HU family DNA-binding protein [Myxococcales bacterium]
MTKAELIERIAKSRNLPPEVTKKCIQQILDLAFEELGAYFVRARVTKSQTPRFTYPGFGTFTKKRRSARKGVNPRTLEPMKIDASFTVDFKPGTELRGGLNGIVKESAKESAKAESTRARSSRSRLTVVESVESVEDAPLRRLRSRDEVELEADDGYDPTLFEVDGLPQPPLQRIRARRTKSRDEGVG